MLLSRKARIKIQDTFHFENVIYKVLHERINVTASFKEHVEYPEKTNCYICDLGNQWQNKKKNMEQDTLHFENAIYMLFLERSNIIASFVEFPKFPEKMSFTPAIWVRSDEVKSRIRIQDIFYFESFM